MAGLSACQLRFKYEPERTPIQIVEPDRDRPELTVFELRSGRYEQTAHITGEEEYPAAVPFPVAIAPSKLVTLG